MNITNCRIGTYTQGIIESGVGQLTVNAVMGDYLARILTPSGSELFSETGHSVCDALAKLDRTLEDDAAQEMIDMGGV